MKNKNKINIKLSSQYSLLLSDMVLRVLILIFASISNSTSPIILGLIHLITILIFFYFIKRRKLGIVTYIKTRSKSYSKFSTSKREINCEVHGDKGIFTFITIISSVIIVFSVIPILDKLKYSVKSDDWVYIIYLFSFFIIPILLFRYNHDNFINENIVSVDIDDELIPHKDYINYKNFLDKDYVNNSDELFFDNDDWIIDIGRRLNEYRINAETFLIESVFLGALTFSAFLAIVGPEGYEYTNHNSKELIDGFISALKELNFVVILTYFNNVNKIYFLIAAGSIICSVFYIAVLLKRYPIIRNIEILSSGLDRAKVWNDREEKILIMELENSELKSDSEKMKMLKSKRIYYSDRIQYELANCEKYRIEIETKFKLISMIRLVGLYIFFLVLFISSRIIHPDLCFILLVIFLYAIITAKLIDYQYSRFFKSNRFVKLKKLFNF